MTFKVVVIGADPKLVESRAMVLRSRHYDADCGPVSEADNLLKKEPDLLVLCSSLAPVGVHDLINMCRSQIPKLRIIQIEAPDLPQSLGASVDEVVKVNYDPLTWISAVDQLLSA